MLIVKVNLILRSCLCNYSDVYILLSAAITDPNTTAAGENQNKRKSLIIKNCASFTNSISEIDNTKIDNAKDIDIVMSRYNLIEYSVNYSESSRSLWNYLRDEPFLNADGTIVYFPANNNDSASFNFENKTAGIIKNDRTKKFKFWLSLKYLSKFFWKSYFNLV